MLPISKVAKQEKYYGYLFFETKEFKVAENAYQSLKSFFENAGFEFINEGQFRKGSWIRDKILFVLDWTKSKVDPNEIFDKTKHAIELAKIDKVQSEINKNMLEGAGAFLKSVENIPAIATLMGSLLIVKIQDENGQPKLITRTLSTEEMIYLKENPQLCNNPALLTEKFENKSQL